jgi:hypothetical protein
VSSGHRAHHIGSTQNTVHNNIIFDIPTYLPNNNLKTVEQKIAVIPWKVFCKYDVIGLHMR